MKSSKTWYVASMGSDPHNQGLLADENTGENIAVTYKAENTALVAAAPELLFALEQLLDDVEYAQPKIKPGLIGNVQIRKAREAISKAKGE
jgi:hypothetical protein